MADTEHGIHILLLPYPSQGHINPILQFGKRLAAHRGVRCTLAATRFNLSQSQPSPGDAIRVATISDGCDRGGFAEAGGVTAYLERLESVGSETVDELLRSEQALGRPVHVVVYDAFMPWAQRVARRRGAACAAFFTQSCAVDVAYGHAWEGRVKPPLAADEKPVEMIMTGLPAGLTQQDLPTFLVEPDDCPAYLDLVVNQFKGLDTADHVLINSFHELEPQESDFMALMWRARTVGPTVPSAYLDNRLPEDTAYGFHLYTPLTATTKAWLDGKPARSVVYVSFGSVATPRSIQMAEVAEGLYNSGKPFLWVVRASETSKIPKNFSDKVKERGLIVTWSPQLEVLTHPAVGCFVTHCGWNSTTEGLSLGVPMVAMPQWSDQPMNAKYIEDVWQLGVRAQSDEEGVVRKEEVERCVREVMEGQKRIEYQQNATRWKEKAKKTVSEGGSSDKNIAEFLRDVGLKFE